MLLLEPAPVNVPALAEAEALEEPVVVAAAKVSGAVAGTMPTPDEEPLDTVAKLTTGTVATVERTVVDDERTDPDALPVDSVTGIATVVMSCTVVDGNVVAAADVAVTVDAAVTMLGLDGMYGAQIPWK